MQLDRKWVPQTSVSVITQFILHQFWDLITGVWRSWAKFHEWFRHDQDRFWQERRQPIVSKWNSISHVVAVHLSVSVLGKRLARKSVSQIAYFVLSGTLTLTQSINQATIFVSSLVVNEERIRQGHWLQSLPCLLQCFDWVTRTTSGMQGRF